MNSKNRSTSSQRIDIGLEGRKVSIPEADWKLRTSIPGTSWKILGLKNPSIRELRGEIKRIKRLDPDSTDYSMYLMLCGMVVGGNKHTICGLEKDQLLYRARVAEGLDPLSVLSFASPPPEMVKTYGRCNTIGSPKFYCATSYGILPYEMRRKAGDDLYVSVWRVPQLLKYVDMTPERLPETSDNDLQRRLEIIDQFLNDSFAQRFENASGNGYKATAAISENFFTATENGTDLDGKKWRLEDREYFALGYMSVAKWGWHLNLALQPEQVERCLEFSCARRLEILARDGPMIVFRELALGLPSDDIVSLNWTETGEAIETFDLRDNTHPDPWVLADD